MQTIKDQSFGVIPILKKPDGSLLFCLVQHQGEHYGFPKGHPNPGEEPVETARRELQEETGLVDVEIIPEVHFDHSYMFEKDEITYDKTVRYFLGHVSNMNTEIPEDFKHEISEMKWLSHEEAREVITYETAKLLLDQVWEFLKNKTV